MNKRLIAGTRVAAMMLGAVLGCSNPARSGDGASERVPMSEGRGSSAMADFEELRFFLTEASKGGVVLGYEARLTVGRGYEATFDVEPIR